jgi:hypothetical protein
VVAVALAAVVAVGAQDHGESVGLTAVFAGCWALTKTYDHLSPFTTRRALRSPR